MSAEKIEDEFPRLKVEGYAVASPETDEYNCIAFAGDDTTEKWDPDETSGRYWPDEVARSLDLSSFIALYAWEGGYVPCDDDTLEAGYEKVAIFCDPVSREVRHAAKQLPNGEWVSKLGDWEDIKHSTLSGLEGEFYGRVAQLLSRKKPGN